MPIIRADTHLQESLEAIVRLLERHRVLDALAQRHEGPRRELIEQLQRRQNLAELQRHLRGMHPAAVAHVLEALPLEDRRTAWEQLGSEPAAAVFVELSDAVRSSLIDDMPHERLVEIATRLDPEDLAYVAGGLPPDVLAEASRVLEATDRTIFDESVRYATTSVGYLMTREWVDIGETQTIDDALVEMRARGALPAQTDHLYVVDVRHILRGAVPIHALLISNPASPITSALRDDVPVFRVFDDVHEVAKAFERYDLVSAPVIDDRASSWVA